MLSTAAAAAGSGGVNDPRWHDAPYVVMISFDGFRHDYLDHHDTPAFDQVVTRGIRSQGLIPVFPSKTFPNHYSIATGLRPARHGLIDNKFFHPGRGESYSMARRETVEDGSWYRGEPIWITAERQGMVSAAYFWVGTEAPIGGVQPSHWFIYDQTVSNEARVDQVLDWLHLPVDRRPHLLLLYFSDVDTAGHQHGPESPAVAAAVARVDAALARLLGGLATTPVADQVNLVLVSDHGMIEVPPTAVQRLPPIKLGPDDRVLDRGAFVSFWFGQQNRPQPGLVAPPHVTLLDRAALASRFALTAPHAPDLMALAEPGFAVVSHDRKSPSDRGFHGYDPAARDMHGLFVAAGPHIRGAGTIPPLENIHIYPFVAQLLGLEAATDIDGHAEVLGRYLAVPE